MDIRSVLHHQLSKPSHIVKVEDKEQGLRLKKDSKIMRYAYSLEDINQEFGSINGFLSNLTSQGFINTTFTFQRTYGQGANTTYHPMKEVTENITAFTRESYQPVPVTAPVMPNSPPNPVNFLGNPTTGTAGMYLGAFVEAERAGDYKEKIKSLENELNEERSKRRRLEEENHSLRLKNETAEERANLKVQTELLNKKSVFESEGFQKMGEALAGIVPHVVPHLLNKGAASSPVGLGMPQESLSPMKASAIEEIKKASDQEAALVVAVLDNIDQELINLVTNHLNK